MTLGELEREVMEIFWDNFGQVFTVRDISEYFPDHAYTTIMTVLARLSAKGFLLESKLGRLNTFNAAATREAYISDLINEALDSTTDRQAVLAHFAGQLNAEDKSFFRKLFQRKSKQ
jgi:predicted transcriptional regulator